MLQQCNAGYLPISDRHQSGGTWFSGIRASQGHECYDLYVLQAAQLLVCDWLLETRTALWENEYEARKSDANYVASQPVMLGFQEDLSSLKKLVQHLPVFNHFYSLIDRFRLSCD